MNNRIYKCWTLEDIENHLDFLSDKTGLDWKCLELEVSDKMRNTLGEFSIKRDKNKKPIPFKIKIKKKLLEGYVPENIVADIITHEFMHYYTTVKENKMLGHGKEYKNYCKKFGFGEEVYSSSISIDKYLGFDDYKYLIECSKCDFVEGRYRIRNTKDIENNCMCPDCKEKTLKIRELIKA